MRRILICTGVLGGGTALVFALAALTATLFPQGTLVQAQWGGWGGGVLMEGDARWVPMGAPLIEMAVPAEDVSVAVP
jgi:hypothetical protein